ncbi:MAG: P-loop NTPase, partial [Phycisphaerales bacterium]|nr:P-loop NTPase [Phycisphaerales bacterium]
MPLQPAQLRNTLATVIETDIGKDIVTAGMVKDIKCEGDDISIEIQLSSPESPLKDQLREQVETALRRAGKELGEGVGAIDISFSADMRSANERVKEETNPLPNIKKIIAVGAGKGGVGKSTVATLLAAGLAKQGETVGLLDGDIYGPSMTTMLGLHRLESKSENNQLIPFEVHGIKAMTIGKLVEPDRALIWRGPRAHSAFSQLATQTSWGELDYLIVDLPPGTGDVPLSLAQLLPLSGAVIICTPQVVAQDDARRAVRMFEQLGVPILGLVENM